MLAWDAVIVAGGADPKLAGEFAPVPGRCLVPVANRPLIVHVLERVAAAGVRSIAVVAESAIAQQVREVAEAPGHDIPIHHVEVPDGSGEIDALLVARDRLKGDRVLAHLADSLIDAPLAPMLESVESRGLEALVVARAESPVGGRRRREPDSAVRVGTPSFEPAGVYILGPEALEAVGELEVGEGEHARLDQLFESLYAAGRSVEALVAAVTWHYRPGADALLEAHRMVLERIESDVPDETLDESTVQGRAIIDPTARLLRTLVRGPAIIGAQARLTDAYVGPYTVIGERAVVEGTEVEHSVLLSGAELRHLGVRVESSLLGPRSHVSRSFALPKAMHLHLGPAARVTVS